MQLYLPHLIIYTSFSGLSIINLINFCQDIRQYHKYESIYIYIYHVAILSASRIGKDKSGSDRM